MNHNLSRHRQPVPRPRIETLSDLIFGLALSIGALTLIGKTPTKAADVEIAVLGFGFSFLILISVWLRYTSIMSVLPVETGVVVLLNIVLLFLVSIEPYLFSLLNSAELAVYDYASVLYALDLAGLMAILALFTHMLTIEERKLIRPELLGRQRMIRNVLFFSTVLFLISALPQFWSLKFQGMPVRIWFWYLSLVGIWGLRLVRIPKRR
jgi:uncharacterized membrane protein